MSKRPSKRELREQLQRQTQCYLQQGGEIEAVERGASGLEDGRMNDRSLGFEKPAASRTPVTDVLRAIDQRRQAKSTTNKSTPQRRRPKRKVIYDDFGEPLRIVWDDD
ncbi:hypothetical protein CHH28_11415 [Bacterioplanes sanyensis]|uniref:Transcriptional regulator SutA RNAP-binding domain-containing protein n=1 Tax=Bacterioplanes sanyensis TaxID=1249553 RepID=A0A222FQC5_9GAMM|nr:hypothetical protein [Bacterioplanes sanyensis]ASP40912.1 hypothetical protein CHH28_11415 [Bacterioplanes sanyensis]